MVNYLIFSNDINHILLLYSSKMILNLWVFKCLSNGIIKCFLVFDFLMGSLNVRFSWYFPACSSILILLDFLSPFIVLVMVQEIVTGLIGSRYNGSCHLCLYIYFRNIK